MGGDRSTTESVRTFETVRRDFDALLTAISERSHPFYRLLLDIGELHAKKNQDYGSDIDPFANVRASQEWGVRPWIGALVRLNDKVHRLKQFVKKGSLANESARDSMMDIAVYSLIALVLYDEEVSE